MAYGDLLPFGMIFLIFIIFGKPSTLELRVFKQQIYELVNDLWISCTVGLSKRTKRCRVVQNEAFGISYQKLYVQDKYNCPCFLVHGQQYSSNVTNFGLVTGGQEDIVLGAGMCVYVWRFDARTTAFV